MRDLIVRFDPRALHWFGSESPPHRLLQPPPSIEAISEPASLRRQLDEVWTAANCLKIALDKWAEWFVELGEEGDAHPGVALTCNDEARRAVKVLVTYRPNVAPFDRAEESELLALLPPIPTWWVAGIEGGSNDETTGLAIEPRVRWQDNGEFLDRYYYSPARLQQKALELRAAAVKLIDLLESFPMTAITCPTTPAKPDTPTPVNLPTPDGVLTEPIRTNRDADTAQDRSLEDQSQKEPRRKRKEPSKDAIAVYRYWYASNCLLSERKTQTELANDLKLMELLGRTIDQGTISRYLKQVRVWLKDGNVLPAFTAEPDTKQIPMSPEKIDLGKRVDRRKQQGHLRNSDRDD